MLFNERMVLKPRLQFRQAIESSGSLAAARYRPKPSGSQLGVNVTMPDDDGNLGAHGRRVK
jgi:hypothetical protein